MIDINNIDFDAIAARLSKMEEEREEKLKNAKAKASSFKELANINDNIGDTIDFNQNVGSLSAMVIINGKYTGIGFDHQDAAEKAIDQFSTYPLSETRGFFDRENKIAFIISGIFEGKNDGFGKYLRNYYTRHCDSDDHINESINKDFNKMSEYVKQQLNAKKVYLYDGPVLTRTANII